MKAFIHIGAGYMQVPAIKYAKQLGLYLVITDINSNAPGVKYADRYEKISGDDVDSFVMLANEIAETYDIVGAFSSSDYGVMVVARLAELYSFPFASEKSASYCLNKKLSKNIWQENGVPVPKGVIVSNVTELREISKDIRYPFIVKPVNSCGSKGVVTIESELGLDEGFNFAHSISNEVIVEEIISGMHLDINAFFIDGEFNKCGVMERFFASPPYHYPVFGIQPSILTYKQECEVYNLVENAAKLLGVDNGPIKGDVIYTDHGPVLLEIAPRFHGDVSTQFISSKAIGFNPVFVWLNVLAGKEYNTEPVLNGYAGWRALFAKESGEIESISGVNSAYDAPGLLDIFIMKTAGNFVPEALDNRAMCGFIWMHSDDRDLLEKDMEKVGAMIDFKIKKRSV